ncbi:helix-turn-helix transcriptional regulator [Streptomyces sp. NPDC007084]|uniref:helix-turn-helix domain-containing protein n=1 Tax=Streptomyces sp. NPDC007084 TaxID=3154313 RepID=UPI003453150A
MPDGPNEDDEWIATRRHAIGARIREERLRQNRTQEWLHLEAGINRWTLQRIEAGEDSRISTLLRIARVLDVDLADLVR